MVDEKYIDNLISKMTLEEKVGQMQQIAVNMRDKNILQNDFKRARIEAEKQRRNRDVDEIQISYVVHLLHQAVFGIVGGWGDLCPADRGLVLWGIAGRTSHPSGVPDYDLLLCGTRPISASVFTPPFAQSSPGEGV